MAAAEEARKLREQRRTAWRDYLAALRLLEPRAAREVTSVVLWDVPVLDLPGLRIGLRALARHYDGGAGQPAT